MKKVTHVDAMAAAKVSGFVTAAITSLFAAVGLFFGLVAALANPSEGLIAFLVGLAFMMVAVLIYGAIGFVLGYFYAWVYNTTLKYHGGYQLTFAVVDEDAADARDEEAAGEDTHHDHDDNSHEG